MSEKKLEWSGKLEIYPESPEDGFGEITHNHFDCPCCELTYAETDAYGEIEPYQGKLEFSCENCHARFYSSDTGYEGFWNLMDTVWTLDSSKMSPVIIDSLAPVLAKRTKEKFDNEPRKVLLFGGFYYYPGGGFNDYLGSLSSVREARDHAYSGKHVEWYQIVDVRSLEILESGRTNNISSV